MEDSGEGDAGAKAQRGQNPAGVSDDPHSGQSTGRVITASRLGLRDPALQDRSPGHTRVAATPEALVAAVRRQIGPVGLASAAWAGPASNPTNASDEMCPVTHGVMGNLSCLRVVLEPVAGVIGPTVLPRYPAGSGGPGGGLLGTSRPDLTGVALITAEAEAGRISASCRTGMGTWAVGTVLATGQKLRCSPEAVARGILFAPPSQA